MNKRLFALVVAALLHASSFEASAGFINFNEPPGYSLLARHLSGDDNTIGGFFDPALPPKNGYTIFTMDAGGFQAHNYLDGWPTPNQPLRPGDGWFFKNPFGTNTSFITIGFEVDGTNNLPSGLSVCSSIYPVGGLLDFPAVADDVIYVFNNANNTYSASTYSGTDWQPTTPNIQVGQSFWVNRSTTAEWIQMNAGPAGRLSVTQPALVSTLGQLNFFTFNATNANRGRVYDADGTAPLSANGLGQLFVGTIADENTFVAVGTPVSFSGGATPGYIRSDVVSIPGVIGGQVVFAQLRAWKLADGATYDEALANNAYIPRSGVMALTAHALIENNLPGIPPPDVNTFPSFSLSPLPSILIPPQSQTNVLGGSCTFEVAGGGAPPLSYQWQFNGAAIPGAQTNTYTRSNLQIADAGAYTVVVTNSFGAITSAVATLTFTYNLTTSASPSAGGSVSNYPNLPGYPVDSEVLLTPLPNPGWAFTGWSGDASGLNNPLTVTMTTNKVITANFAPTYSLTLITNGSGGISKSPDQTSYVSNAVVLLTATANPGWGFTGWSGNASGTANPLSVTMTNSKTITGTFAAVPTILSQPQSQTVNQDGNATFFVSASSALPVTYQWRFNGGNIAGANVDSYTRPAVQVSDGGDYDVVVTSTAGSVTSAVAVLTVFIPPPTIIAQWNFNSAPPDFDLNTGTTSPAIGNGTASLVGGTTDIFQAGDTIGDPTTPSDNTAWVTSSYPGGPNGNKTAGVRFDASTVGYQKISVMWRQQVASQASKYVRLQYTTNGSTFVDFSTSDAMASVGSYESKSNSLSSITSVNGKTGFGIRIVTEFESTATGAGQSRYVTVSGSTYTGGANQSFDMVTIQGEPLNQAATLYPLGFVPGNYFQIGVTGALGANYVVQMSTNLSTTTWSAVLTNASPFIFTESNTTAPQRFYRALFQP